VSDQDKTPPPSERTIIRPARPAVPPASGGGLPQGATPPPFPPPPPYGATASAGSPSPQTATSTVRLDFADGEPELYGPEPLVAAANRLIHLATRLKTMAVGPDLAQLRQLTIRELDAFSKRARDIGLEPKSIQLAHYILCAFLDDSIMSTPWGANSPWSQHSLLAAYHNDVQGGERLFQFAERMEADPNREPRLMELLYLCLSLGFEGRAALDPRGPQMLGQRRSRLAAAIGNQRGRQAVELSPQWRGVEARSGVHGPRVPLWVVAIGLALVALAIFAALLFRLSTQGSAAIEALDKVVGYQAPPPPAPAPQTATPTVGRIQAILQPDIDAGRLTVLREGDEVVIRLVNQGLFGSAQATPAGGWDETFSRLAQAANLTKGPLKVEGHTDDQQIHSLAFPSNLELSEARAKAVARALTSAGLTDSGRLQTAGFGDAQPIADNGTADGRRENRRVEIRAANDVNWR